MSYVLCAFYATALAISASSLIVLVVVAVADSLAVRPAVRRRMQRDAACTVMLHGADLPG